MWRMELSPPTERMVRGVLVVSTATIAALSTAFALDLVSATEPVILAVAVICGGVAAFGQLVQPRLVGSSWLPVVFALGMAYGFAFFLHDHASRDAGVAAGSAVVAVLLVHPLSRAHGASALEAALDRFECVALLAGRSLFVVGIFGVLAHHVFVRTTGMAALCMALGLLAYVLWRDRARTRFLTRVYGKRDPSFRIERDDDVMGFELLPPLLSGTITDAVIAEVRPSATYRTSDGPRPVARVLSSLPRMLARLDRRTRIASTLTFALVCCSSLALITPFEWSSQPSRAVPSKPMPTAPTCHDARGYFAERLTSEVPGVGRATLLTHMEDASIAPNEGVILLVPHDASIDEATRSRALAVAGAIPCRDKLALRVEEPRYRNFVVDAAVVVDPSANRDAVLRDADEQVRELFQPDARAVYNEHIDFGNVEKTFGYRLRHALRHVHGVRSVRLSINGGGDVDIPLGPRDFPRLQSLTLC